MSPETRFIEELRKLVIYYIREYSLSYGTIIGHLILVKDHLSQEARNSPLSGDEWKT